MVVSKTRHTIPRLRQTTAGKGRIPHPAEKGKEKICMKKSLSLILSSVLEAFGKTDCIVGAYGSFVANEENRIVIKISGRQ